MAKNLIDSKTDRQNILNNRYAIQKVEENLALTLTGAFYEGEQVFTKAQGP